VSYVLVMAALELGHPVTLVILVVSSNSSIHATIVIAGARIPRYILPAFETRGRLWHRRQPIAEVFGVQVQAASLKDILRSKQASNRIQDQQDSILIKEMLKRGKKS
jgi:hypothetical protein